MLKGQTIKVLAITSVVIAAMVCGLIAGMNQVPVELDDAGFIGGPALIGLLYLAFFSEERLKTLAIAGIVIAAMVAGLVGEIHHLDPGFVEGIDTLAGIGALYLAFFIGEDEDD